MKLLWHSVGPWVGSGYGNQTATFAPRLKAQGHDVAISAYYGLQGSALMWNGIKVYPAYDTGYGNDVIVTHALDHFGVRGKGITLREAACEGLIITLTDVWVLNAPLLPDMSVAAWVPIDHITLPGITRRWFENSGAAPIAMSRFGQRLLEEAGREAFYVPHGVDTATFNPGDRAEARERTGLPQDAFIVAMVAANVGSDGSRKAFAEQITAFADLHARHPDTLLVLHTDLENRAGVNINRMLRDAGLTDAYIATDQYAYRKGLPSSTVADIYRSANVLSNCSWGEGFGIPIVEAQACGTPVVVTNGTAMPELCGAGWVVGYEPLWHESQEAWACLPRIGEIAAAYEEAYDKADSLRDQAAAFGLMYDADFVTETFWAPTLEALEVALAKRKDEQSKPRPVAAGAPKVRESSGLLWLDRGQGTEDGLGWADSHEASLEPILRGLVTDDTVFVDIGAHVGHWALRLAGQASQVVAFEANPETASILRRNVAINDLGDKVSVFEGALWDERATVRLSDPNNSVAGGSTRTLPADGDAGVEVRAFRLDELHLDVLDRDVPYVVKVDVEGADLHVLRGMAQWVGRRRPVLFIECHDYCGYYERADLERTLEALGYTWRTVMTYKSTWSPDGPLDEPVDADYLIATPNPHRRCGEIARVAVDQHGASQRSDELADALNLVDDGVDSDAVIVEIGCDLGGSLYAWRQVRDNVIGVTLVDNSYETGGTPGQFNPHGATVIRGDSHDKQTHDLVIGAATAAHVSPRRWSAPIDVLVLDGDHSVAGIWQDLADYAPHVRPGGIILLHDIAVTGDDRAHVWEVWPVIREHATELGIASTREFRSPAFPYGWGVATLGPNGFDVEGVPL